MANGPALSNRDGQIDTGNTIRDPLLNVLHANRFETEDFHQDVLEQTEVNFYRGAPPNWLNFHISEQAELKTGTGSPFIKRDGYDTLVQQINKRRIRPGTSTVKLFHQPGSGGTTLAMQVLWDLRKKLRCAVLTGPTLDVRDVSNVAEEVVHLFTAGSQGLQKTVLLLVNDEHNLENLQDSIMKRIAEMQIDTYKHVAVAVLLSCVRKEEVLPGEHVSLKQALSDTEKRKFNQKKEELSGRFTDEYEQFHGFNIMQTNFSQDYVKQACRVFSKVPRRNRPKKTQLAAFLSLLNTYAPGSYLQESQCLDYLCHDGPFRGDLSLEDRMKPFSHLIVTFQQNEASDRRVRMAHHMIAQQCIELMAHKTRSDTARNFLTCFCKEEVPSCLLGFVKDMLTKREKRKEVRANNSTETDEKKEKFSRLILKIQEEEDAVQSASVLKVASNKFIEDAFFPQALARVYYIELQRYRKAEKWARQAMKREPQNSFIADTLGQVYKNHLKIHDPKSGKAKTKDLPARPRTILQLASRAIKAFNDEEELAEKELGPEMKGDGMAKVSHDFNIRGQLGFLQVCNILYDLLVGRNQIWRGVLTKNVSLGSVLPSLQDNKLFRFYNLIKDLRDNVVKKCDFLHAYFTYSKPDMQKEDNPYIKKDVPVCHLNYTGHPLPDLLHDIVSKFQNGVKVEVWLRNVDTPETALPKLEEIKNDCVCECTDYYRSRYLCPLFYLGANEAGETVPRHVEHILETTTTDFINYIMKKDHIFRDLRVQKHLIKYHGQVQNYSIVIRAGNEDINVKANIRDQLWIRRPVSFYLGFTIGGLVAFGIQTNEWPRRRSESCCSEEESLGWTAVTPTCDANMYQLQSEAGRFQCNVSALRWVCKERVSFKYQFSSWETCKQMLDEVSCKPGGPLLDINKINGKIDEMYVPHWTCIDGLSTVSDKFAVLHEGERNEEGNFLEQVSDVTAAHVKIHHPIFSKHGVLTRAGFPMKVHCNVLIYQKRKRPLTLCIYVIPRDPALQKEVQQKERTSRLIQKPNPTTPFQGQDSFILKTDAGTATVSPATMKLDLYGRIPGCFTVSIHDADLDIQLTLKDALTDLWECTVSRDEY